MHIFEEISFPQNYNTDLYFVYMILFSIKIFLTLVSSAFNDALYFVEKRFSIYSYIICMFQIIKTYNFPVI